MKHVKLFEEFNNEQLSIDLEMVVSAVLLEKKKNPDDLIFKKDVSFYKILDSKLKKYNITKYHHGDIFLSIYQIVDASTDEIYVTYYKIGNEIHILDAKPGLFEDPDNKKMIDGRYMYNDGLRTEIDKIVKKRNSQEWITREPRHSNL